MKRLFRKLSEPSGIYFTVQFKLDPNEIQNVILHLYAHYRKSQEKRCHNVASLVGMKNTVKPLYIKLTMERLIKGLLEPSIV